MPTANAEAINRMEEALTPGRAQPSARLHQRDIHVDFPEKIHELAIIGDGAIVTGDVTLGANSVLFYHTLVQADSAPIVVGEGCCIVDGVLMHNRVTLGDYVHVAHSCLIHRRKTSGTLTIGSGTLVGFGSQVHASIGRGCQIAPGVIVDVEIPDYRFVHEKKLPDGGRKILVSPMRAANYARVVEMYRSFWARRIIVNRRLVPLQWQGSGQDAFEQAIENLKACFDPEAS